MLIPQGIAPGLQDVSATRLARPYSLYDAIHSRFGEIDRLTSPSTVAGVSAIGARVEQVAAAPAQPRTPKQPQRVQRVPVTLQAWDADGRSLGPPVVLGYEWVVV